MSTKEETFKAARTAKVGDTLTVTDHGQLAGETVGFVRVDPFKRFIIVQVTATKGDYRSGDQLRLHLDQVSFS